MKFSDIIGNEAVVKALSTMVESGKIAHAILLYENDGGGAMAIVQAYLQRLYCDNPIGGDSCGVCPSCNKISKMIHPDIHYVFPVVNKDKSGTSKTVSDDFAGQWRNLVISNPFFTESDFQDAIEMEGKNGVIYNHEARSIISKLSISSVEGKYQTIVVYLPETMKTEAANRLLKIIEEPPVNALFVFVTHSPEKVMQTIFSRCMSMRVLPLTRSEYKRLHNVSEQDSSFMDLFSDTIRAIINGDLVSALECSEQMDSLSSREKQKAFCIFVSACLRKVFVLNQALKMERPDSRMYELADISEQEMEFYQSIAPKLSSKFCVKTLEALDAALEQINRNVSAKMIFCDLINRMYVNR